MAVSLKRASAKKKKKKQTRWGRAGRPHPTAVLAIEALVLVPLDLRRTVMKRLIYSCLQASLAHSEGQLQSETVSSGAMKNHQAPTKINSLIGLLIVTGGLFPLYQAAAQRSNPSPMAPYSSLKAYCGKDPIPQDVTTIPWIGCFYLSAGHSATGRFSNQEVEVAVDAIGNDIFTVNGTVVATSYDSQQHVQETNVPYVHPGAAGYPICPDTGPGKFCPSAISVFSRNPDKSVLFMVSECFPPQYRVCVLTQENWDYQQSRQR